MVKIRETSTREEAMRGRLSIHSPHMRGGIISMILFQSMERADGILYQSTSHEAKSFFKQNS